MPGCKNPQSISDYQKQQLEKTPFYTKAHHKDARQNNKVNKSSSKVGQNSLIIDKYNRYIDIDLSKLYSLNEYIHAMSGKQARWGWTLKRKATDYVRDIVEIQIRQNDLVFEWPSSLLFEWHVNRRKDPDNVSSAGRKAILDGFQEAKINKNTKFLPNDNPKHILGFIDKFVYDQANFVRVYQYDQNKLNKLL